MEGRRGDTTEKASGSDAQRRRVAIEMVAKHEAALRRTARRYSICAADADDAFQRALEILLTKAPPGDARELVRWMQTVTKHEALAVRRSRERQLSPTPPATESGEEHGDWLALLPSGGPGPAERTERREAIARSREALKTLKPAELRALTLLAEGYSYSEIGEITGYSRTKINRCLAEGRERFRAFLARSESGERCAELRPALSAFCDGEAGPREVAALREHLRVCAHCRAALRAYRAAPGAAAALFPAPILAPSLLDRVEGAIRAVAGRATSRAPSLRDPSAAGQVAASGGGPGAGVVALAKGLAICAGAAGTAAVCVTAGVGGPPLGLIHGPSQVAPRIERSAPTADPGNVGSTEGSTVEMPAVAARTEAIEPETPQPESYAPSTGAGDEPASAGAVESEAPPPESPATPPPSEPTAAPEPPPPSPAGEFGP